MPTRLLAVVLVLILGASTPGIDGQGGRAQQGPQALPGPSDVKIEVLADGDDGTGETRTTPEYKAAYRRARDEADTSLKDARARLFNYGMLGMSNLDPETGLAMVPIAGCVVGPDVLGRAEGNNERVRAWINENGPAPNSLVHWKDELSDLAAFFAARAKVGTTVHLRIGGPTLRSPDGRYTLRQVATQVKKGLPRPSERSRPSASR